MSEAGMVGTMIMLLVLPLAVVVRDLQMRVKKLEAEPRTVVVNNG